MLVIKSIYNFFRPSKKKASGGVSRTDAAEPLDVAAQSKKILYAKSKKDIHRLFDFDQWYPRLEEETFPSFILPISQEIAQAMTNMYRMLFQGRQMSAEDQRTIGALEKEIQEIINHKFKDRQIFVRMSNRSPKDGIPLNELDSTKIDKYTDIINSDISDNQKMIALTDMQMKNLMCGSAKEIMNLLLTSERVFADLLLALEAAKSENDQWSTSIILRQWEPNLKQENEFRLFVQKNELKAISQYNPYCFYPNLNDNSRLENLKDMMARFVKKVDSKIEVDTYILDIGILGDHIKVIELNPFHPTTSACMFSWQEDKDILNGHQSERPEIRVRNEPLEEANKWIDIILEEQKNISAGKFISAPYFEQIDNAYCSGKSPKL